MTMGIIGRKVGMTQIFGPEGNRFAVTIVEAEPNAVLKVKTADGPDGYDALVLGYGEIKDKHLNKPKKGFFAKQGVAPCRHVQEARVTPEEARLFEPGNAISVSQFAVGQFIDVVGTTKGHGFTGVIKRHNMARPKTTHGTHEVFRHGGSLGSNTTPGRVWKGKKMAGQHGNSRVTIQNLMVVGVEAEKNLLVIKGSVPGPNGRLVWIQSASRLN
jgi:large subunit ribosomal protein L3